MNVKEIKLSGVRNFRDFGGHQTSSGKCVVTGQLFRSAHYNDVTAEDIAQLNALGVKFMADLRHADERERSPNRWAPARVLTQADGGEHVAAVEVGARNAAARGRMNMIDAYSYIPYGRRFTALFGQFFRTLADEGGPVIIHCAIGKDRTGILSALLLTALGVDRETVLQDFLATNSLLNDTERARLARVEAGAADGGEEAAMPRPGVSADYLQSTFDVIAQKSGTLEDYFATRLDVTPAHIERLRTKLLVS